MEGGMTMPKKTSPSRRYVLSRCVECSAASERRLDQISTWSGRCQACSTKRMNGLPQTKEARRRNGLSNPPPRQNVKNIARGPDHYNWKGGATPENTRIRLSLEMRQWRQAVFERDNYTCQMCGQRGGDMHADHIKAFSLFPDLRFEVGNGRTLCVPCHRAYGVCVSHGRVTRPATLAPNSAWKVG